jgi:hypothetical protein
VRALFAMLMRPGEGSVAPGVAPDTGAEINYIFLARLPDELAALGVATVRY